MKDKTKSALIDALLEGEEIRHAENIGFSMVYTAVRDHENNIVPSSELFSYNQRSLTRKQGKAVTLKEAMEIVDSNWAERIPFDRPRPFRWEDFT